MHYVIRIFNKLILSGFEINYCIIARCVIIVKKIYIIPPFGQWRFSTKTSDRP